MHYGRGPPTTVFVAALLVLSLIANVDCNSYHFIRVKGSAVRHIVENIPDSIAMFTAGLQFDIAKIMSDAVAPALVLPYELVMLSVEFNRVDIALDFNALMESNVRTPEEIDEILKRHTNGTSWELSQMMYRLMLQTDVDVLQITVTPAQQPATPFPRTNVLFTHAPPFAPASPTAPPGMSSIFEIKVSGSLWVVALNDERVVLAVTTVSRIDIAAIIATHFRPRGLAVNQVTTENAFAQGESMVIRFRLLTTAFSDDEVLLAMTNATLKAVEIGYQQMVRIGESVAVKKVTQVQPEPTPAPNSPADDSGNSQTVIIVVVVVVVVIVAIVVIIGVVIARRRAPVAVVTIEDGQSNQNGPLPTNTVPSPMQPFRSVLEQKSNPRSSFAHGMLHPPSTSGSTSHGEWLMISTEGLKSTASSGGGDAASLVSLNKDEAPSFHKGKLLGRGTSGSVYSAMLANGTTIAVKEQALQSDDDLKTVSSLAKEMEILQGVRNPFIIEYYGVYVDRRNRCVNLFMEQVTGGSLGELVRSFDTPMSEVAVKRFVTHIALGLKELHSKGIVHRDLKADNVLLGTNGIVKLGDFGSSRKLAADATTGAQTVTGTPYFMAPEVAELGDKGYNMKADVWSLGITCAELLSQGIPPWPKFESVWQTMNYIVDPNNSLRLPPHLTTQARDFILSCCERSVDARPSVADLLNHPWIAEEVLNAKNLYVSPSSTLEAPIPKSTFVSAEKLEKRALSNIPMQRRLEIVRNKKPSYRLGKVLGSGAFGVVYLALLEETGEQVAAKKLVFSSGDEQLERKLESLQQEVKVMKEFNHPHIVSYIFSDRPPQVDGQDPCLLLFMEYVPGGTLADMIQSYGRLSDNTSAMVTVQIILGLAFLHSNNTLHRDIKPANILMTTTGTVKLSDFGTAKEMNASPILRTVDANMSMQGTPAFMAPEVVRGAGGGYASDVWSLGCTLMEMVTGEPPWTHIGGRKNPLKTMNFIASDTAVTLPSGLSPDVSDFLMQCLQKDPAQRATCDQLLEHHWIKQFDVIENDLDVESLGAQPSQSAAMSASERAFGKALAIDPSLVDEGPRSSSPRSSPPPSSRVKRKAQQIILGYVDK